jgi:hypothetical protein
MDRLIWTGYAVLAAAAAALALAGCATMRVSSYQERGADLGRYQTYAWAPTDSFSTGDPRLDNNRFFIERVQQAIVLQLAPKGLTLAAPGSADVVIRYHARLDQQLDTSDFDRDAGRCGDGECRAFVYDAGTLLIDFVDARTNRLAWRGWAEGSLDGVIDDQAWLNQKVDEAVTRIMARFPRELSSRLERR